MPAIMGQSQLSTASANINVTTLILVGIYLCIQEQTH